MFYSIVSANLVDRVLLLQLECVELDVARGVHVGVGPGGEVATAHVHTAEVVGEAVRSVVRSERTGQSTALKKSSIKTKKIQYP